MGRYTVNGSTGHGIRRYGYDEYTIRWQVDFYYASSRQRHPRGFQRWTDRKGAERFAKRWGISMPDTTPDGEG